MRPRSNKRSLATGCVEWAIEGADKAETLICAHDRESPSLRALATAITRVGPGGLAWIAPSFGGAEQMLVAPDRRPRALDPFQWLQRRTFCVAAAAEIDRVRPKLLVLTSETLPVARLLRRRPERTVLYITRTLRDLPTADVLLMQASRSMLDQVVWPNAMQARAEAATMGWPSDRTLVLVPATTPRAGLAATMSTSGRPILRLPDAAPPLYSGLARLGSVGERAGSGVLEDRPVYGFCSPGAFDRTDTLASCLFANLANGAPVIAPVSNPYQNELQGFGCALNFGDSSSAGVRLAVLQALRRYKDLHPSLRAGAVSACHAEWNWETQYLSSVERWTDRLWIGVSCPQG